MILTPDVYLIAPVIVLLASTVYATSGFGSTLIAVPLPAHPAPIKYVIPLVVLLDFAGSVSLGLRCRSGIDRSALKWLMPAIAAGVLAGTAVLLAPFIFLGLYIGHRLRVSLRRETVLKLVGGLLVVAGLSLMRRALLLPA